MRNFYLRLPFFYALFAVFSMLFSGCTADTENDGAGVSANRLTTGISGKDLLTAGKFDKILFDIVYVSGHKPTSTSIINLRDFAENRCFKPGGIEYQLTEISSPGKETYTTQDILDLEEAHRTAYNSGNTIAVFVLVVDGASFRNQGNSVILGTAYRNTSFVIFEETIEHFSTQFISNDKTVLESTVLNHEFSHLLGLVNLGTPLESDHEDPENSNHCVATDCLMNYRTDAGIDMSQVSLGGGIPDLDEQCLADLRALGGK